MNDDGVYINPSVGDLIASGNIQAKKIIVPSEERLMIGNKNIIQIIKEQEGDKAIELKNQIKEAMKPIFESEPEVEEIPIEDVISCLKSIWDALK